MQLVKEFSKHMHGEFEMILMRELNYFLGLQIKQLEEGTYACQAKYCHEFLKRFRMVYSKYIDTPMSKMETGTGMNIVRILMLKCRGMIKSLLYLTASRPDIMFSVCMYAWYQSTPKELHLKSVKRILRYLHGTSKYGI